MFTGRGRGDTYLYLPESEFEVERCTAVRSSSNVTILGPRREHSVVLICDFNCTPLARFTPALYHTDLYGMTIVGNTLPPNPVRIFLLSLPSR